jgi:hypothetical protein
MGQPTPPGDLPLIEGLGSEWNEFVSAIPEDRRTELAPKFKERISGYENIQKEYEPWQQLSKSGITPDFADTAIRLFNTIENNPKDVYETIGKHLGITTSEAKEVVAEIQDGDQNDPQIKIMQDQINTMAQVMLAERQMTAKEQRDAEADANLEKEIGDLKKKYGSEVNEREVILRMVNDGMTAEQAHQEFSDLATQIRSRRPAPMIMGSGGSAPSRAIDVTKLDSKGTKQLVAQMFEHANSERDTP